MADVDTEIRQLSEALAITYSPRARLEGTARISRLVDECLDSTADTPDQQYYEDLAAEWSRKLAQCLKVCPPTERPDRKRLRALENRLWDGITAT